MSAGVEASGSLVGNDIVDLVAAHDPAPHPRFAERVLSVRESQRCEQGRLSAASLWRAFACKEAAYKLFVKAERRALPFAHRQFEVSADRRRVVTPYGVCAVKVSEAPGYVHAVASFGGAAVGQVHRVDELEAPSVAVRRQAIQAASRLFGIAPGELHVERAAAADRWDGAEPPYLFHDRRRLAVDLSLSHHGRFVAVALLAFEPRAPRNLARTMG